MEQVTSLSSIRLWKGRKERKATFLIATRMLVLNEKDVFLERSLFFGLHIMSLPCSKNENISSLSSENPLNYLQLFYKRLLMYCDVNQSNENKYKTFASLYLNQNFDIQKHSFLTWF